MRAAQGGHGEVVMMLLQAGAEVNAKGAEVNAMGAMGASLFVNTVSYFACKDI
jgi:hypothetical protein